MKKIHYQFARRTARMGGSIIREILKVSSHPKVISFAGGLPAPATFPLKEFEIAVRDTLRMDGTKALQYAVTEGHLGLKSYLCGWLAKRGIKTTPDQMLLTHGSQQALDLIGKVFLNPGDSLLVEDPTYLGAIQSFNCYEPNYVTIPINNEGMKSEHVAEKLSAHNIRFIYTVPTFQNPAGITMSLTRRKSLIDNANKNGIPIVEDDPYSLLRFKGKHLPSLYALNRGRGVIYISTFSKLLSPGIRLGFILAEKDIIQQLVLSKQATDLQNNTFIQYAVYHYCRHGFLDKHIPFIIKDYSHRASVMMENLHQYFPREVDVVEPDGGMFVWCRMPPYLKAKDIFKKAIRKGVAFVDGSVFYANGGGENTMRLNFTNSTDQAIQIGIKRLAGVIRENMNHHS